MELVVARGLHDVLERHFGGRHGRIAPVVAVLADRGDDLFGRHLRKHPVEVMPEPAIAGDRARRVRGIVLVIEHEEDPVVRPGVGGHGPALVIAGNRLGDQAARGLERHLQIANEGEELRVEGGRNLLEVQRHTGQVEAVEHGDELMNRPAAPLRATDQPRHRGGAEVLAGKVGHHREHLRMVRRVRRQRQDPAVDLDDQRQAVAGRSQEDPFRHDPVEMVDPLPERKERVVVPVDVEARDDRVLG